MRVSKTVLTTMCMIQKGDQILVLDKVNPGYRGITFPGGHIEAGEALHDSVIREVMEETGLILHSVEFCGMYDWMQEEDLRYLVFLYRSKDFTGDITSSAEGRVFWLPAKDFLAQPLAQGMAKVFAMTYEERAQECYYTPDTGEERLY